MKNKPVSTPPKPRKRINHGRLLYTGFLTVCMLACFSQQAFAATTVWQKAEEIMKDVYNQILLISTIAAVVTASIALLMMNFSKSGKNSGRGPCLAQADYHHVGDFKRLGLHRQLHHALLCGRQMGQPVSTYNPTSYEFKRKVMPWAY